MDVVFPLAEVAGTDLALAGGKGANLGELVRAGFAVPDGFVITTAAYSGRCEASRFRQRRRMPYDARRRLCACAIPDAVRDAILAQYAGSGGSGRGEIERDRGGPARGGVRRPSRRRSSA